MSIDPQRSRALDPAAARPLVAGLLARLGLGDAAAGAEAPRDRWVDDLRPSEARIVEGAHPERRAAFAAGRHLARRALADLGAPDAVLERADALGGAAARAPRWPDGFTGSISHATEHCGVVVARSAAVQAVGLDLEAPSRVRSALLDRICTSAERARLRAAGDPSEVAALHFAAREAFYKAWQPATGDSPGFRDVEVEPVDAGRFRVVRVGSPRSGPPLAPASLAGRRVFEGVWGVQGDLLAALIVVPVDAAPR